MAKTKRETKRVRERENPKIETKKGRENLGHGEHQTRARGCKRERARF